MVLDAFNQMGGEEVIRSALSEQYAAKYGKSARTWNDVIQEMTQEIFLQKKVAKQCVNTTQERLRKDAGKKMQNQISQASRKNPFRGFLLPACLRASCVI